MNPVYQASISILTGVEWSAASVPQVKDLLRYLHQRIEDANRVDFGIYIIPFPKAWAREMEKRGQIKKRVRIADGRTFLVEGEMP